MESHHISKHVLSRQGRSTYSLFTFHRSLPSWLSKQNLYLYICTTATYRNYPRTSRLPLVAIPPADCLSYLDSNIMSSASSCASSHGAMASRLRTLALGAKPHINIVLDNERSSYSTLDKLSGKVEIAVSHSTRFDDIEIQFIGMIYSTTPLPHGN